MIHLKIITEFLALLAFLTVAYMYAVGFAS